MSELQGLQSHLDEIRGLDGEVLAITVDPVERNAEMAEMLGYEFAILSDPGLEVIDAYGVRHDDGGIEGDIARPAVFVLDRSGRVVWKDLTDNWRIRVRPEKIVEQLSRIP